MCYKERISAGQKLLKEILCLLSHQCLGWQWNKRKEGGLVEINESTLVGRCGTCFWVVAVQVECVNPLGTKIEIWTTKKVNTIQSRLLFTSALLLVIYIFTFSLFFFLQNDWNKRRRMMAVGFRVEVICRWYYIYSARSFLILFFFFW